MFERIIKDYFSFSKKERVAVIILALLILLILFMPTLFPPAEKILSKEDLTVLSQNATTSGTGMKEENARENNDRFKPADNNQRYLPVKETSTPNTALFYFDPNKLSVEGWKRLGLSDRTIATIEHYIAKGGAFRSKEDLEKIYGLKVVDAQRLMSYVRIEKTPRTTKSDTNETKSFKIWPVGPKLYPISPHPPHSLDVNQADSAEWEALPGIGSRLASRIVHFREKLGGFYSVHQLSELYGLPDSAFQKILPILKITPSLLSKININTIETNELKLHPYFKWNVAAAIVEFRKQHGNYQTTGDLRKVELVTDELFEKIVPYIRLE